MQVPQEVWKIFSLGLINLKSWLLRNNSELPPILFSRNVPLDFPISSGTSLRGGPSSFKVNNRMKTHTQSSYCSSCDSLIIWDMWGMKLVHSVLIVFCVLLALSSCYTFTFLRYCFNWFNNKMLIFLTFSCDWSAENEMMLLVLGNEPFMICAK